ncbi:MAG: glutaredoxin family protein [Thermodesulfobacteriota bacterium]|jgi:glutaredoxin
MLVLTLYTRPDCCLCEEMKATLLAVRREIPFALDQVDISDDPELVSRFGAEVPVLFVNGRKAFKYRVTISDLRRHLLRGRSIHT